MAVTGKRRKREQAVQALYGLSFTPANTINELEEAFRKSPRPAEQSNAPEGFAWDLTSGVWRNSTALDSEIENLARNRRPDQIGRIEMILMRLALYEMRHMNTPPRVAIAEYLEIAGEFGADSAKSFINGILNAAARAHPETAARIKAQKDTQ